MNENRALPSAGYLPEHDPTVHGHAYAVRYQGHHTQPFAAVQEDEELPVPAWPRQYDEPCPYGCPVFPPMPLGESRALLYSGPGITDRTWQARVREGAWKDIPSEFDAAHARVHLPANKANRHIHRDVSNGQHHLGAAFSAHPGWRTDAEVAEGLRKAEAEAERELARQQTDLHRESLKRIAALRSDLAEREAERAEEEERWTAA